MSSQQSLAIWVSHFFESARSSSSFISSITFLETLLPQPSFRGKDTKKRIQRRPRTVHAGCKHGFRDNRGQQRLTARDKQRTEKEQRASDTIKFYLPIPARTEQTPRGRTSPHKSSIKAAGRTDYCVPCCFIGRADLSDLPSVCFSSHVIANMNFSAFSCRPNRPAIPIIPMVRSHPETAPQHIQPLLAPFCALHEPPTGY